MDTPKHFGVTRKLLNTGKKILTTPPITTTNKALKVAAVLGTVPLFTGAIALNTLKNVASPITSLVRHVQKKGRNELGIYSTKSKQLQKSLKYLQKKHASILGQIYSKKQQHKLEVLKTSVETLASSYYGNKWSQSSLDDKKKLIKELTGFNNNMKKPLTNYGTLGKLSTNQKEYNSKHKWSYMLSHPIIGRNMRKKTKKILQNRKLFLHANRNLKGTLEYLLDKSESNPNNPKFDEYIKLIINKYKHSTDSSVKKELKIFLSKYMAKSADTVKNKGDNKLVVDP